MVPTAKRSGPPRDLRARPVLHIFPTPLHSYSDREVDFRAKPVGTSLHPCSAGVQAGRYHLLPMQRRDQGGSRPSEQTVDETQLGRQPGYRSRC